MAWCHQATIMNKHDLFQCWPRFVPHNCITRGQWVKIDEQCFVRSVLQLWIKKKLQETLCVSWFQYITFVTNFSFIEIIKKMFFFINICSNFFFMEHFLATSLFIHSVSNVRTSNDSHLAPRNFMSCDSLLWEVESWLIARQDNWCLVLCAPLY